MNKGRKCVVITQNELLSYVWTPVDPGIGDTWAMSPSANHRGCASRTSVIHAACPAVPGPGVPGVGLRPLALTLLSGPCLAPLLFYTF